MHMPALTHTPHLKKFYGVSESLEPWNTAKLEEVKGQWRKTKHTLCAMGSLQSSQ